MATLSSTMDQNGDTAALTGQPKEVPTLESIQRDTAALFEAQQNEISRLKKLLEDGDLENGELKIKYFKLLSEKKAADRELLSLKATSSSMIGSSTADVKLLEDRDKEIGELKIKCHKLLSEKKTADRELLSLKATIETDGLRSDSNNAKDPAAGDGDSHREDDSVPLGGLHPESYQSTGNATAPAAAVTAAVSQGNAYSSMKIASSNMIGASTADVNVVTQEMLDWLSENISIRDWKPLLRKLGVPDGKIDDVSHAHQGHIKEQRYQGFKEWKKTSRSKGTVSTLLSAMEKLSLLQNIREFCKEFKVERGSGIQVETDSVHQDFSCALHELTYPHLKGMFNGLKDGLRRLNNLSEPQCVSLQYLLTLDSVREGISVLSALDNCSQKILQKYPADKMARLQELQKVLKVCGTDVRAEFKKFVCEGVVGPLHGERDLRKSAANILSKIEEMLSVDYEGTKGWKDLTSWLKKEHGGVFEGVDKYKIDIWEKSKDPKHGAHNILQVWMTTTKATEGKLYAWLVQNGRNDIAKLLE